MGNVTQRQDSNAGLTENFYYDNLYRLDYSRLNGVTNLDVTYNAMGNITARSDVGGGATWTYHATKKHAVTSAGGVSYGYDANGNTTSRGGATITWTSFNYPSALPVPGGTASFTYGPRRNYFLSTMPHPDGGPLETTLHIGDRMERSTRGGDVDWRHYVKVNGETVALISRKSDGTNTVRYVLADHQGSPAVIASSAGSTVLKESYAAFGGARNPSTWSGSQSSGDQITMANLSRRGYTDHLMAGFGGLIHMNGRVQDSVTGRFLSPDPYVPHPEFTQSINRYAYVRNNPLSYTDPSGFKDGKPPEHCIEACSDALSPVTVIGSRPGSGGRGGATGGNSRGGATGATERGDRHALTGDTDDQGDGLEEAVVTADRIKPRPPSRISAALTISVPQTEIPCKAGTQCSLAPRCLGPLSADMQNEYRNAKRTAFANFKANGGNKEESFSIFRNDSTGELRTFFKDGVDSGVNPYVSLSGHTTEIIGHIHNRPGIAIPIIALIPQPWWALKGPSPPDTKFRLDYPNVDFVVVHRPIFGEWQSDCF